MSDARAWLAEAQERASKATEGPWAEDAYGRYGTQVTSNTGTVLADEHMLKPDAEFIAHARTEHPAMAAALTAVLDLHVMETCPDCGAGPTTPCKCGPADCQGCTEMYPCSTVRAITKKLGDNDD